LEELTIQDGLLFLNYRNLSPWQTKFLIPGTGAYPNLYLVLAQSGCARQHPPSTCPTTFHIWKTRGCQCSFRLLMMGSVLPKTCWASYKYGIIKFWYIVVSCLIFFFMNYNRNLIFLLEFKLRKLTSFLRDSVLLAEMDQVFCT